MEESRFASQVEITLELDDPEDPAAYRHAVARKLKVGTEDLGPLTLIKRSLDARRGRVQFHVLFSLGEKSPAEPDAGMMPREATRNSRILIVGDGPAGLFCAYELARQGIAATVIDRGKMVQPRRRDLKLLNARGGVDADSNYCFGEGGAGTYSDGKLYTRSHKRGPVRDVLEVLHLHGAPAQILTDARPHIGSNLLPEVIAALRERLVCAGVRFEFQTRLVGIETEGRGADRRVAGARLQDVETGETRGVETSSLILATGHSARDIFELAHELGLPMEAKGFALGVRIEHPQALINEAQYGRHAGHPKLGAASYKLAEQVEGRGVFSFCMCPGGWIVPAMTDVEHLVVNGMSLSKRDSPFANSGLVVGVEVDDLKALGLGDPLGGIELQRRVEGAAQAAGGGQNRAPAVRVTDFIAGRTSSTLPDTSYLPGLSSADMDGVLNAGGLPLAQRMREGLAGFGRRMKGFLSEEAVLVGVESRTSAPVRILRDSRSFESPGLAGLFLAGEGPGYAGGIVSAAVDGMRVAASVAERDRKQEGLNREGAS